eukprot:TRINITY_DN7454_c0_g1_i2.p2 TRINITY_DN7454_c0_g1~~TRINITY_DN7454_c0_g1_i2.p2  ORF type:complete len:226 (-),score=-9.01 TRINITY_DN7454_c0_g1_i2:70-747(-)
MFALFSWQIFSQWNQKEQRASDIIQQLFVVLMVVFLYIHEQVVFAKVLVKADRTIWLSTKVVWLCMLLALSIYYFIQKRTQQYAYGQRLYDCLCQLLRICRESQQVVTIVGCSVVFVAVQQMLFSECVICSFLGCSVLWITIMINKFMKQYLLIFEVMFGNIWVERRKQSRKINWLKGVLQVLLLQCQIVQTPNGGETCQILLQAQREILQQSHVVIYVGNVLTY